MAGHRLNAVVQRGRLMWNEMDDIITNDDENNLDPPAKRQRQAKYSRPGLGFLCLVQYLF